MKKIILFFLLITITATYCSAAKNKQGYRQSISKPPGDGLSFATAVVITDTTESAGVDAEYKWLKERYPGYTFKSQSLLMNGTKPFDMMDILTNDGTEMKLYFDISAYFGRL